MRERTKIVKRTLADGTVKTYTYASKKAADPDDPIARTVGAVIREYRASAAFKRLRPATVKLYQKALDIIGDGSDGRHGVTMDGFNAVKVADVRRRHVLAMMDQFGIR